ncbi:MAG: hypothetical protein KGP28_06765 [Bdellovibrionales bacterium]|nr:hypothetical protein [Bdellovibrionales bacterium]
MLHFQEAFLFEDPRISAASGLVLSNGHFFCVSDDELELIRVPRSLKGPTQRISLFEGVLPEDPIARKKLKPDLEAIVQISETGSILCIPSGSKLNRCRGVLLSADLKAHEIGFERIYSRLNDQVPDLNLEGAISLESRMFLFQRGNGKAGKSAIINLALDDFLSDQPRDFKITEVELGEIHGERLGFTDACFHQGAIWFLAVAERTESTYEDGEFAGAILGRLDSKFRVDHKIELSIPFKPEGLVIQDGSVFVVTDADDRSVVSRMYQARI